MTKFLFKTKGMVNPKGKPRVYFTCHPEDFGRAFKKICEDIFRTHDCAIYYTENMAECFDEADVEVDLGCMNLFVIPVSYKLLTTSSRAMDVDFAYAIKHHIPVLPIILEVGMDELYSRVDRFGELQYLNPYSTDLTEISYYEKLKKHLESILISNEMAKRVRAAFDAYVFLSYRKKDRRYANELMKLIHMQNEFYDIAIWYDEFLIIGESFKENINRILHDCKLFALLVTPNLLEEPGGKPNFVMDKEYPMAKDSGMRILPAEMEETDKEALAEKFKNVPDCVDPYNEEIFKAQLAEALERIAVLEHDDEPEHNFLIGLAYLDGIDVEVNYDRAIKLIRMAAESNLAEACQKLVEIYSDKNRADYDIEAAILWQKRHCALLFQRYQDTKDEQECVNYLFAEISLAKYELNNKQLKDSRNTCWRVIKLCRDNGGYGRFINSKRIPVYIEVYSVLGDMFYSRADLENLSQTRESYELDLKQTRECYDKAISVYSEHLEEQECSERLLNIVASCYLKLSELLSNPLFSSSLLDQKNKRKYLENALTLLIETQERYFDASASSNLGNCYVNLGKLYEKESLPKAINVYDKAYEIFDAVSRADDDRDVSVYMHRLYLGYGDAYQYHSIYDNAEAYYEKAINICLNSLKKSDALEMNYCYCVACLKIIALKDTTSEISNHKDIEEIVLSVAEWLVENCPIAKYQALLADIYLCSDKNMVSYGVKAFEIYRSLAQEHPEIYDGCFWRCRRELWKKGLLSEAHFPFVRLKARCDNQGRVYFVNKFGYKFDWFYIFFLSDYSYESIDEIMICQYALQGMRYEMSVQLCEPGLTGTRLDPSPEEFVYVAFKEQSNKMIQLQRCYG